MRLKIWLFLVLCGVLGGSAMSATAAEPIKIAALFNLTGPMAAIDVPGLKGAQLKARMLNQAGGLLQGRQVQVMALDTRSDLKAAAAKAQVVLAQGVAAGLGYGDTDYAMAVAPYFQAQGVPFLTSGATHPDLPQWVGDGLFMAAFGDDAQARAMADFARRRLHSRQAVVWTDNAMDFAKALARFFKQSYGQAGGRIIQEDFFQTGKKDFSELIARLKELRPQPDLIFVAAGPEDAAQAVQQLRAAGISLPIAGGDSFDSPLMLKAAGAHEVFFSTHFSSQQKQPGVQAFINAYRKEYGVEPDAFAALGFDALGLLADAIRRAGSTEPSALRRALAATRNYAGVTGEISYTSASRVPRKPVTIMEVTRGRFREAQVLRPQP